ncbi:GFA family protein [Qipengyuania sediminis]|uniref:GFA family protein n=1 Tax=Qipengyuania sediminis TaxID=1532023 RepID=UPI001F0FDE70|nr:GFA family protein [Qipengyuania sediminis]
MGELVEKSGGCQCGRVRYTARVDPAAAYPCHCRMCQRATGGVYAAMVQVDPAHCTFHGEPNWYASSAIAERAFCPACGSPIGFRYIDRREFDLTLGTFDDLSGFRPQSQFGCEGAIPGWQDLTGIEGTRSEDYAPLQERWRAAGVAPPE